MSLQSSYSDVQSELLTSRQRCAEGEALEAQREGELEAARREADENFEKLSKAMEELINIKIEMDRVKTQSNKQVRHPGVSFPGDLGTSIWMSYPETLEKYAAK